MSRYDVRAILKRFEIAVEWEEGTRLWARCPFHLRAVGKEDASATNWFIRASGPRAGQSHCFSCGSGGTLPWLVMHVLGFASWGTAKEWLDEFRAEDEPLPSTVTVRVAPAHVGRPAFAMPDGVVDGEPLAEWPEQPREYLRSRGVTSDQVLRWSLGYALAGKLENRVVIPVHGYDDELHGYMARAFVRTRRKYLYPSTEEHPDLDALFGERRWPTRREVVYACEGALNALAVERAFPGAHVAAIGGSQLRPMHAAKLSTFGEVVVLTDPDEAGEKAARAMQGALGRHALVTRVTLPAGRDANDLAPEELRQCVESARSDSRRAT